MLTHRGKVEPRYFFRDAIIAASAVAIAVSASYTARSYAAVAAAIRLRRGFILLSLAILCPWPTTLVTT